jgi:lipid-A-disaccharide synthase
LKRSADHVLCIFPFEPALLADHGIPATYVGHPLAQVIPSVPDRAGARNLLGLAESDLVLAILPGSREDEINQLAYRFFKASRLVLIEYPAIKLVVPALPRLKAAIERAARRASVQQVLTVVVGQSHIVLAACDVVLVASGTATLEAALFKRPMVIGYHMPWLSWQIMKRKQIQPWVGLPNILLRDFAVPELIQNAATPEALADAVLAWLADPVKIQVLQQRFATLHLELRRDTIQIACEVIENLCRPPPQKNRLSD